MTMITGKCSICGQVFRSRNKANQARKIGKHWRKKHPAALSRRISRGIKSSHNNPSVQDLVSALKDSPRAAIGVYKQYTEKQYQAIKRVMDGMEQVLPPDILIAWKAIEAVHDYERE